MMFIDTGAFIGRYVERDQHHADAVTAWDRLRNKPARLATSNFVLDETFTLLARRTDHAFAAAKARSLLSSRVLTILRPELAEEQAAVAWFEKLGDQGVSFTDCVSFVLMRRERIKRVFGFDRHFCDAGFELWP
jgi:predicted nucleic acid-binding protein